VLAAMMDITHSLFRPERAVETGTCEEGGE